MALFPKLLLGNVTFLRSSRFAPLRHPAASKFGSRQTALKN